MAVSALHFFFFNFAPTISVPFKNYLQDIYYTSANAYATNPQINYYSWHRLGMANPHFAHL